MHSEAEIDQITLRSRVWGEGVFSHEFYIGRLNTLKTNYKHFLLTQIDDIFQDHMIRRDTDCLGLNPKLKSVWTPVFLQYWLEFTDNNIVNWCQYMNESMINALYLGVKVCFSCHKAYFPSVPTTHIIRLLLESLEFTMDDFFDSHDILQDKSVNYNHAIGLVAFYKLNVQNIQDQVLSIRVPSLKDGVAFSSSQEFARKLNTLQNSYFRLIKDGIEQMCTDIEPLFTLYEKRIGVNVYFKATLNSALKDIISRKGEELWISMALTTAEAHTHWCRLMNDELISQIYTACNCVKFCNDKSKNQVEGKLGIHALFKQMFELCLERTCINFLLVDSVNTPTNVREEDRIQWSGNWGMKMFCMENFYLVDDAYYNLLNGIDPYDTEPDDQYYPLSAASIPRDQSLALYSPLLMKMTPLVGGKNEGVYNLPAELARKIQRMTLQ
jgi:hypothetical protein